MKTILFPTDFTHTHPSTLDWLRLFARQFNAGITLVHVFQPMIPDSSFLTFNDMGSGVMATQELEEISRQHLENQAAQLRAEDFLVQTDWRVGDVETEVLDAANTLGADLIITGRSEKDTFFDRLAGSASTDIATATDLHCPVLVVPASARGAVVRTVTYVMQTETTQSQVTAHTATLIKAFDATLHVRTNDEISADPADLLVLMLGADTGIIDDVLGERDIPLLIYPKPE